MLQRGRPQATSCTRLYSRAYLLHHESGGRVDLQTCRSWLCVCWWPNYQLSGCHPILRHLPPFSPCAGRRSSGNVATPSSPPAAPGCTTTGGRGGARPPTLHRAGRSPERPLAPPPVPRRTRQRVRRGPCSARSSSSRGGAGVQPRRVPPPRLAHAGPPGVGVPPPGGLGVRARVGGRHAPRRRLNAGCGREDRARGY